MKIKDKEVTEIVIVVNGQPISVNAGVLVLNGIRYDVFTTTTTTTTRRPETTTTTL